MKKLFLIVALGVLSLACSAQVEKVVLTTAVKGGSAQIALDSIKKMVPEPLAQTLAAVTSNAGRAWSIDFNPANENTDVRYYYVYLKGKDGKQTMIYDRDGNLVQVKRVLKNARIPETVRRTINTRYNGWTMVGNEVRYINDTEKIASDYKVILKKGALKKAVFINPEGEVKMALPTV